MRLSIIMPVLNEAANIEAVLLALSRTDDIEVIVVDGGSSDATRHLAEPLADRVIGSPRGRALQMNAGAAASHGDVLLFLHADTCLPQQAFERILNGLAPSNRCWGRFDVDISGRAPMLKVIAWCMNLRSRLTGIATGDQAIFMRREDFFAVGSFPAQLLMEDIEMSRRLNARSAPLCLRTRVTTSGRRWEKHGIWRTILLMWSLRLRYWLGTPADKLARKYQ